MKIDDIILEHDNWPIDTSYTEKDLRDIKNAMQAVCDIAKTRGVTFKVKKHFFDQMQLKRGLGKTTANMLLHTFGRIINRGLHLYKGKEDGFSLALNDQQTGLIIGVTKIGENEYRIGTMVRDLIWLGPEQRVVL